MAQQSFPRILFLILALSTAAVRAQTPAHGAVAPEVREILRKELWSCVPAQWLQADYWASEYARIGKLVASTWSPEAKAIVAGPGVTWEQWQKDCAEQAAFMAEQWSALTPEARKQMEETSDPFNWPSLLGSTHGYLGARVIGGWTPGHDTPTVFSLDFMRAAARLAYASAYLSMRKQASKETERGRRSLEHERRDLERKIAGLERAGDDKGPEAGDLRESLRAMIDKLDSISSERYVEQLHPSLLPGSALSHTFVTSLPFGTEGATTPTAILDGWDVNSHASGLDAAVQACLRIECANESEASSYRKYYKYLKDLAALVRARDLQGFQSLRDEMYSWLLGIPKLDVIADRKLLKEYEKQVGMRAEPSKKAEAGWRQGWSRK